MHVGGDRGRVGLWGVGEHEHRVVDAHRGVVQLARKGGVVARLDGIEDSLQKGEAKVSAAPCTIRYGATLV